ncbi:YbjP/YqhG family protein [Moraxella sp. FZLJ2107]|uniref:DUF3828 domain-containing protein n=1 Tax=unclassified Moraxella TaxID=2685852 RepID=UPI0020C8FB41|nr:MULTISPECIES: DUF3828 domain-containing protein [unclassified Moraxella]UTO05757.1 YbjP/YqhG family protein [Moraxella sp. FZLJ2107]UTO22493.1 YbjP/YqhG family protein [Moraxella sp. FZLJ2109]
MKLKVMMPVLLGSVMIASTANASFWDKLNGVLDGAGKVLGTVGAVTGGNSNSGVVRSAPMAQITDEQKQIIQNSIQANTDDKFLNDYILEAKDNVAHFLEVMSCQYDGDKPALGRIMASGANVNYTTIIPRTKYHPVDQCMTVSSVGGWYAPVRDKIVFKVTFVSDVSGESLHRTVSMQKENGKWLVENILNI